MRVNLFSCGLNALPCQLSHSAKIYLMIFAEASVECGHIKITRIVHDICEFSGALKKL